MTRPALNGMAPLTVPRWEFSPDARVDSAVSALYKKYPPILPDGTARVRDLLARLGNPHLNLPPVYHVAGTNGKGSTLAFLQAIFESAGKSVHKYTSPHLVRFEERIVINGQMIAPDLFLDLIRECEAAADLLHISFFEFFTALTMLAFSRYPADAVLIETGLGGKFDATNIFDHAAATILTRISYDHQRILGSSLDSIARHKAGILRSGVPAIIAEQVDASVMEAFADEITATGAPVFACNAAWQVSDVGDDFTYSSKKLDLVLPKPALAGDHQLQNAGCAIAALEFSGRGDILTQAILEHAMQNVTWQGRLQQITTGKIADLLPAGFELWLDGAHNDSGAEILIPAMKKWRSEMPLYVITAFKRGKDSPGFYKQVVYQADDFQVLGEQIGSHMLPAAELCDMLGSLGAAKVSVAENLESALSALVFQFKPPARILVTGSLYLVGHVLKING